jgi:hypothetical protein
LLIQICRDKSGWSMRSYIILSTVIIILSLTAFRNKIAETFSKYNPQQSSNPTGWVLSGNQPNQYKAGIDDQTAQHGKRSATVECIVENPIGFSTLMQSCFKKDFINKRVKMTGYIKTQNVNSASMWARVDDYVNKVTADFDNMYDRPLSGTNEWTKCEIIFDVTSRCSVLYGFILSGTGKIWVDNVTFEIVDNSVNKTAQPMDTPLPEGYQQQIENLPQELPEKPPVNLDFED